MTDDEKGAPESAQPDTENTSGEAATTQKSAEATTPSAATSESAATTNTSSDRKPSARMLGIAAAVVAVVMTAVAAFAFWQAHDLRSELSTVRAQHDDDSRAQRVAADYAVAAAQIDYRNFDPWFGNLRKGVAPRLADQFSSSEPALRDLLGQLQWVSSGKLIGSDITARNGNTYEVQVFVDVTTSNVQSPQGVKTTALYPITVDKDGWRISDISGGIAPMGAK